MISLGGSFWILRGLPLIFIVFFPAPTEQSIISHIRTSAKFARVYTRTNHYIALLVIMLLITISQLHNY